MPSIPSAHMTTTAPTTSAPRQVVGAATEYGTLRRVAMRYAGDDLPHLDGPDIHPVLARQKTTSSWSPYRPAQVRAQQDSLVRLLRERGTEVVILPEVPGCPAQHYPRDIAFVIDRVLFAARLNSAHRLPEADALTALTSRQSAGDNEDSGGSQTVGRLSAGTIEGGDVMLHDGYVLVGLGEETSPEGAEALQAALTEHGVNRDILPVHFAGPGIVHLDDHFNIVAPGVALIHRAAFPPHQIAWFEEHFEQLIDVTSDEARAVQINMLAVAPGVVIAARGSDRLIARLRATGIEVLVIDYSEVTRVPGSLRCTTLPLQRT